MKKFIITFLAIFVSLLGYSQRVELIASSHSFNPDIKCSYFESIKYCGCCSWDGWTHYHYYTYVIPGITYIATPTIRVYTAKPKPYHPSHPKPTPQHMGNHNVYPRPPEHSQHYAPPSNPHNSSRPSSTGHARSTPQTRK